MMKLRVCGATCAPLLLFTDPGCPWRAVNSTSSPSVSEVALIANISHGLWTRRHPAALPPTICPNCNSGGAWLRRARGASHRHEVTITIWQMFYIPAVGRASNALCHKLHHNVFWHCVFESNKSVSVTHLSDASWFCQGRRQISKDKNNKNDLHVGKISGNIDWTAAVADLTTLTFGNVWNAAGGADLFFFFFICNAALCSH